MMKLGFIFLLAMLAAFLLCAGPTFAQGFSGGGGSILFGTGSPNSIDAATELGNDLGINEETGNYVVGVQGFYQGERYRIGGAIQTFAWGGVNPGSQGADIGTAGLAAVVVGLYSTYTVRHDRVLLNLGGVAGAGRTVLGYSLIDGSDRDENVATFYLEPNISAGVAVASFFGVEFQLAAPIFLLTEDLQLTYQNKTYSVQSSDMWGVNFSLKLTFGKIANP